jgi:hypothetical protein
LTALLLRFVDADVPAVELVAVEPLCGRGRSKPVGKLDERESSRPTAVTIGGQEHAQDFTRLAKEALEVALGGLKAQIPYEESRVNGVLLSCVLCDGAGCRERNQQLAEVVGGKPAIRAGRGHPDTIACLVGTTWSPCDHFDFETVGHTLGRDHLAGLVTEEERPRVAALRTIDEDALSYRDYESTPLGRRRDGPSAGQERRQRTSSGKCA